jgi:hypothetical protein
MHFNNMDYLEDVIGMPYAHKNAFVDIARQQKVVIVVRATGPTCHGLLEEGYDTKGYRIHGKSCNWGPMAGFVMRDPRLNKSGAAGAAYNRSKHAEALYHDHEGQGWRASVTPLKISHERISWLEAWGHIVITNRLADRMEGTARHGAGADAISFKYILFRDPVQPHLWGVFFSNDAAMPWQQEAAANERVFSLKNSVGYEAMLALTNPPAHRLSSGESYLNAVTGDYDLFAVWPFAEKYNPDPYGADHRPLGTVRGVQNRFTTDATGAPVGPLDQAQNIDQLERHFADLGADLQGTKVGNITPRIYKCCQLINSIIGRNVLWHSDEAARPYATEVDLPIIAFTPAGYFIGVESIQDFADLIHFCESEGVRVTLSSAWTQEPTGGKPNRLGAPFENRVPLDGRRVVVPAWYNA